jgi:hypothetical protein
MVTRIPIAHPDGVVVYLVKISDRTLELTGHEIESPQGIPRVVVVTEKRFPM